MRTGAYTTFADWRFVHRARLNLLPLNGARMWGAPDRARHNAIVARLRTAASRDYTVAHENQVVGDTGLRPDLVLVRGKEAIVLDVTCPFENTPEAFTNARNAKLARYQPVAAFLRRRYQRVTVDAVIVGALGTWDAANDSVLRRLCSRPYLRLFKKLCRSQPNQRSQATTGRGLGNHDPFYACLSRPSRQCLLATPSDPGHRDRRRLGSLGPSRPCCPGAHWTCCPGPPALGCLAVRGDPRPRTWRAWARLGERRRHPALPDDGRRLPPGTLRHHRHLDDAGLGLHHLLRTGPLRRTLLPRLIRPRPVHLPWSAASSRSTFRFRRSSTARGEVVGRRTPQHPGVYGSATCSATSHGNMASPSRGVRTSAPPLTPLYRHVRPATTAAKTPAVLPGLQSHVPCAPTVPGTSSCSATSGSTCAGTKGCVPRRPFLFSSDDHPPRAPTRAHHLLRLQFPQRAPLRRFHRGPLFRLHPLPAATSPRAPQRARPRPRPLRRPTCVPLRALLQRVPHGHRCLRPPSEPATARDPDPAAPEDDAAEETVDDPTLDLPPDHNRLLAEQVRVLRGTLRDPPTEESWQICEEAWHQAVALAAAAVRLPPLSTSRTSRPVNPETASDIQRLYRRNRRRAMRLIL
ncbi:hypothetical protein MTO96_029572 [Rhipicephalus appendiculatus]